MAVLGSIELNFFFDFLDPVLIPPHPVKGSFSPHRLRVYSDKEFYLISSWAEMYIESERHSLNNPQSSYIDELKHTPFTVLATIGWASTSDKLCYAGKISVRFDRGFMCTLLYNISIYFLRQDHAGPSFNRRQLHHSFAKIFTGAVYKQVITASPSTLFCHEAVYNGLSQGKWVD